MNFYWAFLTDLIRTVPEYSSCPGSVLRHEQGECFPAGSCLFPSWSPPPPAPPSAWLSTRNLSERWTQSGGPARGGGLAWQWGAARSSVDVAALRSRRASWSNIWALTGGRWTLPGGMLWPLTSAPVWAGSRLGGTRISSPVTALSRTDTTATRVSLYLLLRPRACILYMYNCV